MFHSPKHLPFKERGVVQEQVEKWLRDSIIKLSNSEYSSQVIVVKKKKKDGSSRICVDFRKLNQVVVKDQYPFPLIEDILAGLDKFQKVE